MELLSVLGQYLLLSFVLPGFCYVAVLLLSLPQESHDSLKANWLAAGVIGGLLLSSVAFAIEISVRYFSTAIDCDWFPRIPFDKIHDMGSVVNFFAGETFMHLNIGLGLFVIWIIFLIHNTWRKKWKKPCGIHQLKSHWFAIGLAVIVAANLAVSSYLFKRVDDIAYNQRDEVAQQTGSGSANYCRCLREHSDSEEASCSKLSSSPERILTL
jgi:hypothetical protein